MADHPSRRYFLGASAIGLTGLAGPLPATLVAGPTGQPKTDWPGFLKRLLAQATLRALC